MDKSPIERACDAVGGQVNLATAIGVSPQAVSQWVTGKRPVPVDRVKAVVRAAAGAVTPHELAPEIFPEGFEFPPEPEKAAA